MSGRTDAQKNAALYHNPAGNARILTKLWNQALLLSLFFDTRVERGSLDEAEAESCEESFYDHDPSPINNMSKFASLAWRTT
jgi:hypothetical protein